MKLLFYIKDGADEKPLNCTAVPIYSTLKEVDTNCVTDTLLLNKCMGGCGKRADYCCKPSDRFQKTVKYTCPNGTAKSKKVSKISRKNSIPFFV